MPMPWTDAPITAKSEDELGRTDYAVHAASLIANSHSWEDSIVFGLTGPWGSGKSSMLGMISEELDATCPRWQVARFTPWATGDVTGLLSDFYASLSESLPGRSKQIRNALGTLVQVAAPAANAIPWVGGAAASAASSLGAALKKQTPWDKAFNTAADELKKLGTPVLMIADDIDRLQTEELLALLKVVRLLGRFPGVHYLLAYDEGTLFQALSEANLVGEDDGAAARFMEKIVQYPLVVPPLLSTQLLARLDAGLSATLADAGRPQPNGERLGHLVEVYRSVLGTPRAIDRYLAQLRHHIPLVQPEEIDDEDVIVLTLLRTAFPTLYQQLPRWRDQLISGHTDKLKHSTSGIEYEPFDIEPLLETVPTRSRADARTLLTDLFPKLRSRGVSYASSDRRISDARYFDRYFAMGIPSHDVSDLEVAKATDEVGRGQPAALTALLSQANPDRVVLVVDKSRRFAESLPKDDAGDALRLALVKLLVAVLDDVHDKPSFFMSPRERVVAWASQVVTHLTDMAPADALLDALTATADLATRIEVIYRADLDEGPRPACLDQVIAELSAQATKEIVVHLEAQDSAPENTQPGTIIHFVLSTAQAAPLATAVAAGLASGAFGIADVAARVIPIRILYGVGSQYELSDFDQETFNALVPPAPDPWYQSTKIEVDKHDLSWANRREYAAGRAKQPPA
ncbi:KAP family NTPase [Microlunatus soli]|uniref:KAP family P-loop domain-containing protein n=1 Tax=Microlunatus soli TaxID=630515 RepID=A0A1H2A1C8_9ACTN|nr:KAP family NTPase [Microlunatus soli]SDT39815.1 KAP family P-loop domain-containing protein [Microlunatus soli]